MEKLIASIIKPNTVDQLKESYKANQPFMCRSLGEGISDLINLPFLKSFEDLFKFWPKTVDCYLPGVSDEVNSKTVSVQEARKLFEQGRGLIFNDANTESEILKNYVDEFISELGLSSLTYGRSLIYAIPAGKVTDPHFDQNINFVYQVKGLKKWWVAPNTHVKNPLTRHTIGASTDPELASYTENMPTEFPGDATEYILKPGSFLFVPRGAWHKTQASDEDTLSISFTFTAPTWIDYLTTALKGRLSQSSHWRETANFVNDEKLSEEAIENFNVLLSSLTSDIPNWQAEDIIGAIEQHDFNIPENS